MRRLVFGISFLTIFFLIDCTGKTEDKSMGNTQEEDTLENVPEGNIRPTGDMRSVPPEDSVVNDSIK